MEKYRYLEYDLMVSAYGPDFRGVRGIVLLQETQVGLTQSTQVQHAPEAKTLM